MSDDGKFALVEFVAADKAAFKDLLADASVKKFVKGKDNLEDIQAEFKKYKKDFDLNLLSVRIP